MYCRVITSYSSFIRVERLGQAKQVQCADTNRAPIGYPRVCCPCPTSTYIRYENCIRQPWQRPARIATTLFTPVAKKSGRLLFKSVGERTDQWAATGSPNWWIVLVMVDGRWVSSDARLAVRTWLALPSSFFSLSPSPSLFVILSLSLFYHASPRCPFPTTLVCASTRSREGSPSARDCRCFPPRVHPLHSGLV